MTLDMEAIKAEHEALTKALTGLTCGGSEFFIRKGDRYVADIDACVAWVRRRDTSAHERWKETAFKLKDTEAREAELIAQNAALREALEEIADHPGLNACDVAHDKAERARIALSPPTEGVKASLDGGAE